MLKVSNLSTYLHHILTTPQVQFHMAIPWDIFTTDALEVRDITGSRVVVHLIDHPFSRDVHICNLTGTLCRAVRGSDRENHACLQRADRRLDVSLTDAAAARSLVPMSSTFHRIHLFLFLLS